MGQGLPWLGNECLLSPFGQNSTASPWVESERETFFRVLLHDDRESHYIISTDERGVWSDTAIKRDALAACSFDSSSNYYITHNGFTGKRRLTDRVRQLNALFFDLDCHGATQAECATLINDALGLIFDAVQGGLLPNPNIIVDSGRGIHLYYVLERSIPYRFRGSANNVNEKGVSFFKKVQEQLADVLDELLVGLPGIKVDRAVFDHTRVSRIPGTFNAKAGRYASLVSAHEAFWHLPDLASYKSPKAKQTHEKKRKGVILSYHPLMMSRLAKVAELQEYRHFDCEGVRELMCFVYYNTAVQIYDRGVATSQLDAFNARFNNPLPQSELSGIVRTVDEVVNVKGEKGHYILNAETLVRLLGLTEREMLDLQFFSSKRMAQRMEAKRKTKEKRAQRDERIIALYQNGQKTQQEVAQEVGCSARTVYAVLQKAGLTSRRVASRRHFRVDFHPGFVPSLVSAMEDKAAALRFDSFYTPVRNFLATVFGSDPTGEEAEDSGILFSHRTTRFERAGTPEFRPFFGLVGYPLPIQNFNSWLCLLRYFDSGSIFGGHSPTASLET